jgi:hypothetical protein
MATGSLQRTPEDGPSPVASGLRAAGLHHLLELERLRGVRRINMLRFWGVSAFFALFLLLGGVLRLPAWQGNLRPRRRGRPATVVAARHIVYSRRRR